MSLCPHGKHLGVGCKKCGTPRRKCGPIITAFIKLFAVLIEEKKNAKSPEEAAAIEKDARKIMGMRLRYVGK